ncbi:hypothetical protein NL676_035118 [Syzygium grande]|nr:hypothetical protein NL676_035118 [Syzygium grande]
MGTAFVAEHWAGTRASFAVTQLLSFQINWQLKTLFKLCDQSLPPSSSSLAPPVLSKKRFTFVTTEIGLSVPYCDPRHAVALLGGQVQPCHGGVDLTRHRLEGDATGSTTAWRGRRAPRIELPRLSCRAAELAAARIRATSASSGGPSRPAVARHDFAGRPDLGRRASSSEAEIPFTGAVEPGSPG